MTTTTTTRYRPINLAAWEVRAILDGRKTQTRRLVKPQRGCDWYADLGGEREGWYTDGSGWWHVEEMACPFGQPGDHLWGRETYGEVRFCGIHDGDLHESVTAYKADNPERKPLAWRPSTQMPRWASRIDLLIKSVRIERLQEISGPDCWAEGIESAGWDCTKWGSVTHCYEDLWASTNGPDSWDANPFVWVIEHEVVK